MTGFLSRVTVTWDEVTADGIGQSVAVTIPDDAGTGVAFRLLSPMTVDWSEMLTAPITSVLVRCRLGSVGKQIPRQI